MQNKFKENVFFQLIILDSKSNSCCTCSNAILQYKHDFSTESYYIST